jgi:hypothetical protein
MPQDARRKHVKGAQEAKQISIPKDIAQRIQALFAQPALGAALFAEAAEYMLAQRSALTSPA